MLSTPFTELHIEAGAKMTPFSGYNMPLHYGSQIAEHQAVREDAGVFDVSHMMITDISGAEAKAFLQKLIANDVAKLEKVGIGKALYSAMLNETAGVVDDVIVYLLPFGYRIVSNAGTRAKVKAWFIKVAAAFQVQLTERDDFAMLAIQGPHAIAKVGEMRLDWRDKILALKLFQGVECDGFFIARTGYTGEEGLEVMIPLAAAAQFWRDLLQVGVKPCGLAARDTLRLEAGMNLYGQDMDESVHPLEAGLAWCVDLKDNQRNFIGRDAVEAKIDTPHPKQVGLVLLGQGVLRAHQVFRNHLGELGVVTSGTFSPTLKQSIAMARVPSHTTDHGFVQIRGQWQAVRVQALPFR